MTKGVNILTGTPRKAAYESTELVGGGNGTEGIHADGNRLILDGRVIAGAGIVKRGIYEKDGKLCFNDAYVQDYPTGLTTLFTNTVHWYTQSPYYGSKQGAAVYGDWWYQFYSLGHVIVFSISGASKVKEFNIPQDIWPSEDAMHCSSAVFSREFANPNDELPMCYISNSGYVCVFNLNGDTPTLVRWFYIEHNNENITNKPPHGGWAVFDFATNRGWAVGYPQGVGTGVANHVAGGRYELIPFTFPQSGSGEITSNITIDYSNRVSILKENVTYLNSMEEASDDSLGDRDWSNIQDGEYRDGHIYILNGGSNGQADRPKILDYNLTTGAAQMMYTNIYRVSDNIKCGVEAEGIACFHNGWLISGLYSAEKIFVL